MGSMGYQSAFLFVSNNPIEWRQEKVALENRRPHAIVIALQEMTTKISRIYYEMVNGCPVFTSE